MPGRPRTAPECCGIWLLRLPESADRDVSVPPFGGLAVLTHGHPHHASGRLEFARGPAVRARKPDRLRLDQIRDRLECHFDRPAALLTIQRKDVVLFVCHAPLCRPERGRPRSVLRNLPVMKK